MSDIVALSVRATLPQRRRAGIDFTSDEVVLAVAQLSPEQIAALRSDPHLVVTDVDLDAFVTQAADLKPGLRVCTSGDVLRRASLDFTGSWLVIGGGEIDESQLLSILRDPHLQVEVSVDGSIWTDFPDRFLAVEVLQDHIDYDIAHGRSHDLVPMAFDHIKFREAEGAEDGIGAGMSAPDGSEAKVGEGTDDNAAPAVDPLGTAPAAAAGAEESREGTNTGTGVATPPVDGGKEPEGSLTPPVAAPAVEGDKPATARKPGKAKPRTAGDAD